MKRGFWRSKWWLVGGYWVTQAMAVYFVTPLVGISAVNVSANAGDMGSVTWTEYAQAVSDREWMVWASIVVGVLTASQLVFVWPVRKPVAGGARGVPVMVSLGVAGAGIAGLSTALVWAVGYTLGTYELFSGAIWEWTADWGEYLVLGWCLVSWAVATPLLVRFCRKGRRETVLSRVASRLFVGTMIETVAIIPLDVMVRRKGDCHCGSGTFLGLLMCASVGLFALGPAIFLPLVMKRRKRWYEGKCDGCGYDMTATLKAERCPECGMGWRGEGEGAEGLRG